MLRLLYIIVIFNLSSCDSRSREIESIDVVNLTRLQIQLRPVWTEAAIITLSKNESGQSIGFLLKNNQRADPLEDTFYFVNQFINDSTWNVIDTAIIMQTQNFSASQHKAIMDGFAFDISVCSGSDTRRIYIKSPTPKDTLEYVLCMSILTKFKQITTDSIVENYFEELIPYLDHSREQVENLDQPLFKLRELRYNWQYRR